MKKITFLFAMLLLVTISFAQDILIDENFDGATIPADWHAGYNDGTGTQLWTFGSGVVPGSVADFTTNAAIFDDDAAGDTGNHDNVWLWYGDANGVDVSLYTQVTLTYDYALNENGNGETLSVGLWDGSVFIPIKVYNTDTDPTTDTIDITAALAANPGVNASTLFIGFGYDDNTSWGWGAGIDNVKLEGTASNDYCIHAINVPVNPANSGCTNPTIANNMGATDSSPYNGTPSCGSFNGGDIWFSFTAPATGEIKVIVPSVGEWSSFAHAVSVNSCSSTAQLACEVNFDINSNGNIPSEVIYSGLTPGDSYFLRAWDFSNDDFGEVSFCIEEYDSTASVGEEVIDGLSLYPNPVEDTLNIKSQENISKVAIYNLIGQEVRVLTPNTSNLEVDLSNLDSGVYIVKILSNDKEVSKKF